MCRTMDHIHRVSLQLETTTTGGKKIIDSITEFSLSLNNRSWAVSLHHISRGALRTASLWSVHRCLWGREGISMEIFKYLQYKAWRELHTSKPRIIYILWKKQVRCLTQQWTTFVQLFTRHKCINEKERFVFAAGKQAFKHFLQKANRKYIHECRSRDRSDRHISQMSEQRASLTGGVSVTVSAHLFWPVCFADWYAARPLRAPVRIWISNSSQSRWRLNTSQCSARWEVSLSVCFYIIQK